MTVMCGGACFAAQADKENKLSKIVIWGDMAPVPAALTAAGLVVSFSEFMKTGAPGHLHAAVKAEKGVETAL